MPRVLRLVYPVATWAPFSAAALFALLGAIVRLGLGRWPAVEEGYLLGPAVDVLDGLAVVAMMAVPCSIVAWPFSAAILWGRSELHMHRVLWSGAIFATGLAAIGVLLRFLPSTFISWWLELH